MFRGIRPRPWSSIFVAAALIAFVSPALAHDPQKCCVPVWGNGYQCSSCTAVFTCDMNDCLWEQWCTVSIWEVCHVSNTYHYPGVERLGHIQTPCWTSYHCADTGSMRRHSLPSGLPDRF